MAVSADIKEVLDQSDRLFKERQPEESFELLAPYADGSSDDPELLWRLVRMYFRQCKNPVQSKTKREELAKKGYEISKKALALASENSKCNQVCV